MELVFAVCSPTRCIKLVIQFYSLCDILCLMVVTCAGTVVELAVWVAMHTHSSSCLDQQQQHAFVVNLSPSMDAKCKE